MIRRDACLMAALAVGGVLLVWLTRPLPDAPKDGAPVQAAVPSGPGAAQPAAVRLVPADQSLLLGRTGEAQTGGDAWDKALEAAGASVVAVESWAVQGGGEEVPFKRGGGVFVGGQGELLLPYSLVAEGQALRVYLADGTARPAVLAAVDRFSGLALARVRDVSSKAVRWAQPVLRPGRVVVLARGWGSADAVGFGLLVVPRGTGVLADLSGGPEMVRVTGVALEEVPGAVLLNGQGEVVGMVQAAAVVQAGPRDLAAIPAEAARASAQAMLQGIPLRRPYLGVAVQPVDRDLAQVLGLPESRGALVSDLMPEGPGAKAGLEPGDVILRIGDFAVHSHQELRALVGRMPAEQPMRLEVWRGGTARTVEVAAAERWPVEDLPAGPAALPEGAPVLGSVEVKAEADGLVVASFKAHTVVASGRLSPGDRILEVDGMAVATVEEFAALREKTRAADAVLLRIDDGGMRRYLVLKRP